PILSTGVGDVSDNIAVTVLPRTVLHGMVGVFRRPKTEPIVMFAGQDQTFHSRFSSSTGNLVGIEIGWIEHVWIFVAASPPFVGKCVDREMKETVELHFVPVKLTL